MVELQLILKTQPHINRFHLLSACRPLLSEPLCTKLLPYVSLFISIKDIQQYRLSRTYFSAHCPVTAGGISMLIADNGATGGGSATEAQSLCLLNGSSTYLHPATGSLSSIDISISDPSLFLDFTWQVLRRTCHVKCQTSRAGY